MVTGDLGLVEDLLRRAVPLPQLVGVAVDAQLHQDLKRLIV
jgi:hypothetical protein